MATYRITHTTKYRYDEDVSSSYGEVHLLPRDLPRQRCLSRTLTVDPAPHDLRQRDDFYGNRASFFSIVVPHARLSVSATSVVSVAAAAGGAPLLGGAAWEQVRDDLRQGLGPGAVDAVEFTLDSPLAGVMPELVELAAPVFTPRRPVLEAVAAMSSSIHDGFAFDRDATDVTTKLDVVLERRAGVCQDFAHLLIATLRSVGLAARYVSGYLETDPPPGRERLVGADRSHAWVSVWVPDLGWVDVDPTNDRFVGDRYVTIGWGRDYRDVPPVKGVIFTTSKKHELEVAVDVTRVDDEVGIKLGS